MVVKIEETWKQRLAGQFDADYFKQLVAFVKKEYQGGLVYPPPAAIFRAFDLCPFKEAKVVILGQDPYHGPGQANGLCFAVNEGVVLPPSLKNIYKEIAADLGVTVPQRGSLENWAKQGVLLLNATLTVQARTAGSHQKKGWEEFTDAAIEALSEQREGLVFMLWGRYARNKGAVIDREKHLVLEAPHPSPLSAYAGFFGCGHFSKANQYLAAMGKAPIKWEEV
jgi:uracil-DNA glycosylase